MKPTVITSLITSSLLLLGTLGMAQGVNPASDSVQWSVESFTDLRTDTTVVMESKFITRGPHEIEWTQYRDERQLTRTFEVTAVADHWSSDNYIEYSFLVGGQTSTCRITMEGSAAVVKLTFNRSDRPADEYSFEVTSMTKLTGQ